MSVLLAALLALCCALTPARQAIETAMARTAVGDLAGAETIYRDLAGQDPDQGLPALARFLALTGGGEPLEQFLAKTAANESTSSILRARVLLEAGKEDRAIAFLRDRQSWDNSPALAWFAAGVYARAGLTEEAGRLYLERLRQATDAAEAEEALGGLVASSGRIAAEEDLALLERWLLHVNLPAEERLAFLDEAAQSWPMPENANSEFKAFLISIKAFAAADLESALAVLPMPAANDPAGRLCALQRLRILSQLGQSEEAGRWAIWLLGKTEPENRGPGAGDATEAVYLALQARDPDAPERATRLIRMRPYDPEPMRRLMRFYQETGLGRPEQVPDLIGLSATNPQVLGQCGYVLATEGLPAAALVYYDRALDIDPEDPFVRLNRAACLTRLGHHSEAESIYRHFLEQGHRGRPYHVHELILRLWNLAQELNAEEAYISYFRTLASWRTITWHQQIRHDVATVLLQYDRPLDAAWFQRLE